MSCSCQYVPPGHCHGCEGATFGASLPTSLTTTAVAAQIAALEARYGITPAMEIGGVGVVSTLLLWKLGLPLLLAGPAGALAAGYWFWKRPGIFGG